MEELIRIIKEGVHRIVEQLERLTGNTGEGDLIIGTAGAVGKFKGKAKYAVILKAGVLVSFTVDNKEMLTEKGYTESLPALTILQPGSGRYITYIECPAGMQVQIFR
ncbi:MAG: hypothetical protein ACYDEX_19130 [Mobilitalea sp.]